MYRDERDDRERDRDRGDRERDRGDRDRDHGDRDRERDRAIERWSDEERGRRDDKIKSRSDFPSLPRSLALSFSRYTLLFMEPTDGLSSVCIEVKMLEGLLLLATSILLLIYSFNEFHLNSGSYMGELRSVADVNNTI